MALSKLKIDLEKAEQGSKVTIGKMEFTVKKIPENVRMKLREIDMGNITQEEKVRDKAKLIFSEIVSDWSGVTTGRLSDYIVSKDFHEDKADMDLDEATITIKRPDLEDKKGFAKLGDNTDLLKDRFGQNHIVNWKNLKEEVDGPEIPFSKSKAVSYMTDPAYEEFFEMCSNFATSPNKFRKAKIKDIELDFSPINIKRYLIDVDDNKLLQHIIAFAANNDNFREEQIKEDIEQVKK